MAFLNHYRESQFGGSRKYFIYNDFVKYNYKIFVV